MLSLRELAAKKLTITIAIHNSPNHKFRIFKEEIRNIDKSHRLYQIRRQVKIQLVQQLEKEYIKQYAISDNNYPNIQQQSLFFRLINNTFFNNKVPRTNLKGCIKTSIQPRIQLELIRLVLLYYPVYATHTHPRPNSFTFNRTPLHLAVVNNNKYIVKLLLQAGADPNILDTKDHESPLQNAANRGSLEIVKMLLDNASDANSKDRDGLSPLSVVLEQILHSKYSHRLLKYEEILNLLLKHGAK
jgi:hypothetical protein